MKAQPLADRMRREAALIALSFKQLDGECREGLREYAPLLHTVKLTDGKLNSRHSVSGLLRPDYSEKSQSRRTSGESGSSAEVKVDVTAASGLQVKNPSKKPQVCGIIGGFQ